jgi:hypothetical protein
MDQTTSKMSAGQRRWLYLGLAIPLALLGADSFARAAGFPNVSAGYETSEVLLRMLAGVSVGLIALTLLVLLRVASLHTCHFLDRVDARPHIAVSITLLVCGTFCVLGMLYFEYRIIGHTASIATSTTHLNLGAAQVSIGVRVPLFDHLIAVSAFLSGVALLALGVWSSVGGGAAPAGAGVIKDSQLADQPPRE